VSPVYKFERDVYNTITMKDEYEIIYNLIQEVYHAEKI